MNCSHHLCWPWDRSDSISGQSYPQPFKAASHTHTNQFLPKTRELPRTVLSGWRNHTASLTKSLSGTAVLYCLLHGIWTFHCKWKGHSCPLSHYDLDLHVWVRPTSVQCSEKLASELQRHLATSRNTKPTGGFSAHWLHFFKSQGLRRSSQDSISGSHSVISSIDSHLKYFPVCLGTYGLLVQLIPSLFYLILSTYHMFLWVTDLLIHTKISIYNLPLILSVLSLL